MFGVFCEPSSKVTKERYSVKSTNVSPTVTSTAADRLDFMNMIKTLEFRRVNKLFQEYLNSGMRQIKNKTFLYLHINLETLICHYK